MARPIRYRGSQLAPATIWRADSARSMRPSLFENLLKKAKTERSRRAAVGHEGADDSSSLLQSSSPLCLTMSRLLSTGVLSPMLCAICPRLSLVTISCSVLACDDGTSLTGKCDRSPHQSSVAPLELQRRLRILDLKR